MENLVEIDSNNIADFLENFVDSGIKILDELDLFENDGLLASIPYGKIVHYAAKKFVEIKDPKEALQKSVALSHVINLLNGSKKSNIPFKINKDEFKKNLSKVKTDLNAYKVEVETFDTESFFNNNIVKLYSEKIDLLFESYFTEFQYNRIKKYRLDYLKYDFLKILETKNTVYGKLINLIDSKSFKENLGTNYLLQYQEELKNSFNELVLNDAVGMTLADIYIEPEFRIHEYCLSKPNDYNSNSKKGFQSVSNESIHKFLNKTLKDSNSEIELRSNNLNLFFILGYPGQGKSSFCKKILYDIYGLNKLNVKKTFYIKIRNIVDTVSLLHNPIQTLYDQWASDNNSKELKTEKNDMYESLLILDGLDELFIKENLQDRAIDEFCRIMVRETEDKPNLKVIITSRYGYISLASLKKSHSVIIQLKEFNENQQLSWLNNYNKFHPETNLTEDKIKLYNNNSKYSPIKELITQPILLHLIATLKQDVTSEMNRSTIYSNLFTELIQRSWADEGQIDNLKGLTEEDLREFLRNIAYVIFQSGREYIHKNTLISLPDTKSFITKLDYKDRVQDVLKNIMIAFYFQETKKESDDIYEEEKNDYAIEFLHKSLQEYLVAEKIWERLQEFIDKDTRRNKYILDSVDVTLDLINHLFSEKEIPKEIFVNLFEIIDNSPSAIRNEIALRFEELLPKWLESGLVKNYKWGSENYILKETILFKNLFHLLTNLVEEKNYMTRGINTLISEKRLNISLKSQVLTGSYLGKNVFSEKDEFHVDLYNIHLILEDYRPSKKTNMNFKFESLAIFNTRMYQFESILNGHFNNSLFRNCEVSLRPSGVFYNFNDCLLVGSKFFFGSMKFKGCTFSKCVFYTAENHSFLDCTFIECIFYFHHKNSLSVNTTRKTKKFLVDCKVQYSTFFVPKNIYSSLTKDGSTLNCAFIEVDENLETYTNYMY